MAGPIAMPSVNAGTLGATTGVKGRSRRMTPEEDAEDLKKAREWEAKEDPADPDKIYIRGPRGRFAINWDAAGRRIKKALTGEATGERAEDEGVINPDEYLSGKYKRYNQLKKKGPGE
jgi:hypothetical protein